MPLTRQELRRVLSFLVAVLVWESNYVQTLPKRHTTPTAVLVGLHDGRRPVLVHCEQVRLDLERDKLRLVGRPEQLDQVGPVRIGRAENGEVDIVVYVDELVRKVGLEQLRAAGTRCRVTVGLIGANAACERDLIILGS